MTAPDLVDSRPDADRQDIAAAAAPDRLSMRSMIAPAVALVAALAVLGWSWSSWQSSSASFADSERISGNYLGAGRVEVGVGRATAQFRATGLAAGDSATGRLEVTNDGTLPLVYSLRAASGGGPLASELQVRAWNGSGSCDATVPAGAATWDVLGDPDGNDSPPATGRLGVGESRLVCLFADLPIDATSEVQGRRLDLVLGIDAVHDVDADITDADGGTP